ncbi:uncharacterized protein LOC135203981 [Macrobrachium nipponense]|uniref:uncharacterized protein LOC135203981 n=1 Tax=Macrobrachium nipponense TaxID=159736 RepID=UPI0030C876D8
MAQFTVQKFAADPSAELASIQNAKKLELLELASHLSIATRSSMRKNEIRNQILEDYMRVGKLGNEARQYITREPSVLAHEQQLEYERISLEREKLAAQKLESERQAEEKRLESERQMSRLKLEFEMEKARLQLALEREKEKLDYEASLALKFEQEKAKLSRENKEHEISVLEAREKPFDLAKNIKLVPTFTDYDPEDYFKTFEEIALHLDWPRDQWVWLLRPKLTGKAAKVCRHLENTTDFQNVKQAILDAFSISVEGYRQTFRNKTKFTTQTYVEFASEKLREFRKWVKSAAVSTFAELENLIVLEEFKRKLPLNIMMYLEDREEKDLLKALTLADTYSLIHKFGNRRLVVPNVIVMEKPVGQNLEPDPDCSVNPSCVVTRSQKSSSDESKVTSVLKELNIKQTLSAAYHPESQGALERWHQTFKSMLRKFCVEKLEKSDLLLHDIELVPGTTPIRQQSYRVGPEIKNKMKEEVEYLLRHGLARQNASDAGAGGVLLQESDGILHPVSYTSTKFKHHQKSYSTIEKEALSLVLALQKYECYLLGAAESTVSSVFALLASFLRATLLGSSSKGDGVTHLPD